MQLGLAIGSGCAVLATVAGAVFVINGDAPATAVQAAAGQVADPADAVASYWTSKRMDDATPLDGARSQQGPGLRAQGARLTARAYGGIPTVGALFFRVGNGDHYCTASVVVSSSRLLLITAAHCIHGGRGKGYVQRVAFVPKYDRGRRPYGVWLARRLFVDRRWASRSDPDLDIGYLSVHPRDRRKIQNVVGGNRLAVNRGYVNTVNVTGYPSKMERPIWCRTKTRRQARFQLRMDCNGFSGGTSGSPWLLNYNTRTHTGLVNGVIGGLEKGGANHWISYSSYFDKDAQGLRTYADRHA